MVAPRHICSNRGQTTTDTAVPEAVAGISVSAPCLNPSMIITVDRYNMQPEMDTYVMMPRVDVCLRSQVRDLYSTFRNFRSRMHDFLRFRQVGHSAALGHLLILSCVIGLARQVSCFVTMHLVECTYLSLHSQVTARLDRFPDATADDLRRCDGVCIICRRVLNIKAISENLPVAVLWLASYHLSTL